MRRALFILVAVALLAGMLVMPASASNHDTQTVTHVVRPGDTLARLARQYCTTWQAIYAANRTAIGPNPDILRPGIVLRVPANCGIPVPPPSGVYDRGPSLLARDTAAGDIYTVAFGDTLYSVARRFGLTVDRLAAANGIRNPDRIYGGQKLTIPGLGPGPVGPFITITSPAAQAVLPATFTVSGEGGGLFEGEVVVRAEDRAGRVLALQPTILQGLDVVAGGTGTYDGKIVAYSTSPRDGSIVASASVLVTFTPEVSAPFIKISCPTPGSTLPPTFVVNGRGGGLFEGSLIVRAEDSAGHVLAEQPTILQGVEVGAGGTGSYWVELTVNVSSPTAGKIVAYAPSPSGVGNLAYTSVAVTFKPAP